MQLNRRRELSLDLWAVLLLFPLNAVPFLPNNSLVYSLTHQVVIGLVATLGVYIMLRMDLLAFTVPAFMAIGGYAAAIVTKSGSSNLLLLMAAAFVVPALFAIPLGALVLRLKGTYFIFITYIFNEILQLLIFETPTLTGGSDGIAGLPPAAMFGIELSSPRMLLLVTITVGIVAALATLAVTHRFRPEFSSIEENETLAQSLGVAVWKYRSIGFIASAGVSGLAGFALVNQLSTAHPSSFASFSAINYIAYVFVGGRRTMLGPVVGTVLLVSMSNAFSSQAQYSSALFGLLLIAVVTIAPGGLVGTGQRLVAAFGSRLKRKALASEPNKTHANGEHV
ncbi:branched-chain amino acid ABC transporter permease [Caballeronia zhejiangensis]|uniref:branched-chain amino acid ABC transporter permease n=1 Tax=Caballeronia zhejiangensis TaxID=871203 RepID=UPI001EF737E2|nr:branched-chain amino acid ABC transporter permease [Caballeronia zhejiangensis]MCG7400356.1 branched-chain amino acid ABC transporter permease [Caballeronia zhejiangensis]